MDEAGYGPNLGPLLITVTKWRTPDAPHECDFYRLLKGAVQADGHDGFGRLHVADSKQVFVGKEGFRSLETTALCLLTCLGWEISSFQSLWRQLTGGADRQAGPFAPWYELDVSLPVAADRGDIDRLSQKLFQRMEKSGLALVDLRSDLVVEERFNRLADGENSNKGLALSRLAFGLLRRLWEPAADGCALVVGDKHGGRNRYDELLSEVLDGDMIFRLEERQAVSRYRIGRTEKRICPSRRPRSFRNTCANWRWTCSTSSGAGTARA
jgi:hypothetical protein